MKKLVLITGLVLGSMFWGAQSIQPVFSAAPLNLSLETVATGFVNAVDIVSAGDDRLFVVEQRGSVRITQPDGSILSDNFLDINERVKSVGEEGGYSEQGLLSLAFHPDYASNGYFYVLYTRDSLTDTEDGDVVISRFSVSGDPNIADDESETILMAIEQPYLNHNGGSLEFGPDGFLYISTGDGGSAGDPEEAGQSLETLLGKILRIDVNGTESIDPDCGMNSGPYKIPDNPYDDGPAGDCDEIWAYGLRNPWRFSFDILTGDMFIGDVGQELREEVNFQPASSPGGENYGWDCYEGNLPYTDASPGITCGDISNYTFPIFDFVSTGNCSVIGGEVYRGSIYPEMYGHYIFTDFCSGIFWDAYYSGGSWTITELADLGGNFRSFGLNQNGEIFLVDGSKLYHVVEDTLATPPPPATPMNPEAAFGLNLIEVADGFTEPTTLTAADGPNLFVAERKGKLWLFNPTSQVTPALVLDLTEVVDTSGFQEGLIGAVKDPNFESNGHFYVNYTDKFNNTVVSRFEITNSLPLTQTAEHVIFTLPQPFADNNGGGLAFGPDGYLYVATGDGGSVGDPNNLAQDPGQLYGKVLRIDVHGNGSPPDCGSGSYTVPGQNPYSGAAGCKEVWQLGFRNIWGLSFDALTNDLWIADVGDQLVEEINFQPAGSQGGANYGWSCYEGTAFGPNYDPATCSGDYIAPYHSYDHSQGRSVTGGYVYRGVQYPFMQGYYLFADFVYGKIWSLDTASKHVVEHYSQAGVWSAFGEGNDGMLYIADFGSGKIFRIDSYAITKSNLPVIFNE